MLISGETVSVRDRGRISRFRKTSFLAIVFVNREYSRKPAATEIAQKIILIRINISPKFAK